MSWSHEEAEKAFVEVKAKAITDKNFRELVLSNPQEAVEQVTGKPVPESFKIKVIESDPNYHMTFVLPEMVSEELSEDELEDIAGGACGIDVSNPCAAHVCGGKAGGSLR